MDFDNLSNWGSKALASIESNLEKAMGLDEGKEPTAGVVEEKEEQNTGNIETLISEETEDQVIECEEESKTLISEETEDQVVECEEEPFQSEESIHIDESSREPAVEEPVGQLLPQQTLQIEKLSEHISFLENAKSDLSKSLRDMKNRLQSVRQESTETISSLNEQLETLTNERNSLRKVRDRSAASEELVKAKDEQIAAIMREGEGLAKKQAVMEGVIKGMRKQLNEKDEKIQEISQQLLSAEQSKESLSSKLSSFGSAERERMDKLSVLAGRIENLSKSVQEKDAQVETLKEKLQTVEEKYSSKCQEFTQMSLREESSLKQLRQVSAEFSNWKKENGGSEERETQLLGTIRDLNKKLEDSQAKLRETESNYKGEIEELRMRYEQSEKHSEDLVSAVPEATRPLLRQIDSLEMSLKLRTESWNVLERKLREKLKESERESALARSDFKDLEEAVTLERKKLEEISAEMERLQIKYSKQTAQLEKCESAYKNTSEELSSVQSELLECKEFVKNVKLNSDNELNRLKASLKTSETSVLEKKQVIEELKNRISSLENKTTIPTKVVERDVRMLSSPSPSSRKDHYSLDSLQGQLRVKDGELSSVRKQLDSLRELQETLTEELILVKSENRTLEMDCKRFSESEKKYRELESRYETALDLIGRKEEELEEVKSDLVDVKDMFRQQVTDLLDQIEALSKS